MDNMINEQNDAAVDHIEIKNKWSRVKAILKKVIPFALVGVLCFVLGIGSDRLFLRHTRQALTNRPAINRMLPKNFDNQKPTDKSQNKQNKQNKQGKNNSAS